MISPDIAPLISMLETLTRRKQWILALRSTTMCLAVRRPGILPEKLIVAVSSQCRFPRSLPSIKADLQITLVLLKSPFAVSYTSPGVRIVRLKLLSILLSHSSIGALHTGQILDAALLQ